jgi:hypothetical protein
MTCSFERAGRPPSPGCHLCGQYPDRTVVVRDAAFLTSVRPDAGAGMINTQHDWPFGTVVEDGIHPAGPPALANQISPDLVADLELPEPGISSGPAPGDMVTDLVAMAAHEFRARWYIDVQLICELCAAQIATRIGYGDVVGVEAERDAAREQRDDEREQRLELEARVLEMQDVIADGRRDRVELEATVASLERRSNGSTKQKKPVR